MKASTLARLFLGLLLSINLDSAPPPAPHHFSGIAILPGQTAMLTLDGRISNLVGLTGTISNQFRQLFDLYPVEASPNLKDSQDQWMFDQARTHAVFLQVRGGEHLSATDVGWTMQTPQGREPALAINAGMVWFFNTYPKGETLPFPANPEIYNVQGSEAG